MRLTARRAFVFALAALGVPAAACVLADPPASVPPTPVEPPEIDHELVQPPVTAIMRVWEPNSFAIPILELDTSATLEWEAFIDYDPIASSPSFAHGEVPPDPAGDDGGVRMLEPHLAAPADLNRCHTLEVLVAIGFERTPVPNSIGGDSVTWFYSPTGSLEGCPVFEAGAFDAATSDDASVPIIASEDAGADG